MRNVSRQLRVMCRLQVPFPVARERMNLPQRPDLQFPGVFHLVEDGKDSA
jgi:hypothetical protein